METAAGDPITRRFSLGDVLIVVVTLALVLERLDTTGWLDRLVADLSVWREWIAYLVGRGPWDPQFGATQWAFATNVAYSFLELLLVELPCAAAIGLMVAQPLLRLRCPRPPRHELIRQSGFVACLVSMWAVLLVFAIAGDRWYSNFVLSLPLVQGISLLLLWVVLGLPPWRTESTWIDRIGRAVGWALIVAVAAQAALNALRPQ
jgi:hypothetical protein